MLKPSLRVFGTVLTIATTAALFQFSTIPALAAGETPSATASASATPSDAATQAPKPTQTPIPQVYNFDPSQYSLTQVSSPWIVVNKITPLSPTSYKPKSLVKPSFDSPKVNNPSGQVLARSAANALVRLARTMKADGAGDLILQSAYRSFASQTAVHAKQVARLGTAKGEALAARPGYSEHQTGLAADVAAVGQGCVIQICFAKTRAGSWLAARAYEFGFIIRYPKGKTSTTGYQYEPWHLRFVGVSLAGEMRRNKVSVLESFWKLPAAPAYK